MRLLISMFVVGAVALGQGSGESLAQSKKPGRKEEVKKEDKCEHGVKKTICTRCNPKLAPVFKAKNDWCQEHDRAESQCVICNPELAKKGVK